MNSSEVIFPRGFWPRNIAGIFVLGDEDAICKTSADLSFSKFNGSYWLTSDKWFLLGQAFQGILRAKIHMEADNYDVHFFHGVSSLSWGSISNFRVVDWNILTGRTVRSIWFVAVQLRDEKRGVTCHVSCGFHARWSWTVPPKWHELSGIIRNWKVGEVTWNHDFNHSRRKKLLLGDFCSYKPAASGDFCNSQALIDLYTPKV